jgi:RNA polymerase sigma factor (TIGR02999 family)
MGMTTPVSELHCDPARNAAHFVLDSGFAPQALPTHVMNELYPELRRRAENFMRGKQRDWTLQTTSLVNDACLRLFGQRNLEETDRGQILAMASTAMRSILVDHTRRQSRMKRQPQGQRVPLDEVRVAFEDRAIDLLSLDEALTKLAELDPRMARAVDMHFFAGVSLADTAEILDMPLRTLERHWNTTKAWLRTQIE